PTPPLSLHDALPISFDEEGARRPFDKDAHQDVEHRSGRETGAEVGRAEPRHVDGRGRSSGDEASEVIDRIEHGEAAAHVVDLVRDRKSTRLNPVTSL